MERDINVGMNKDLDCSYIMRFEVHLNLLQFFPIRYKERFEQDGNVFVVMNYIENGFFLFLVICILNLFYCDRYSPRLYRSLEKVQCSNNWESVLWSIHFYFFIILDDHQTIFSTCDRNEYVPYKQSCSFRSETRKHINGWKR
jgi:hypothetical protein